MQRSRNSRRFDSAPTPRCFLQILMPFIIFGGLLINLSEIPVYFVWYSIFSFIQYGA